MTLPASKNMFTSKNLKKFLFSSLIWGFSKQLFVAIKLWGIENTNLHAIDGNPFTLYLLVLFSGIIDGLIFAGLDPLLDKRFSKVNFRRGLFLRSLLFGIIGIFTARLSLAIAFHQSLQESTNAFLHIVRRENIAVVAVYLFSVTFFILLLKEFSQRIDMKDFIDILMGRQPKPTKENRVFMFLDLNASTTQAEVMGSEKYSHLVFDFFNDINDVVKETGAEIFQYAGDEVILTWKVDRNFKYQHSIDTYFKMVRLIEKKAGYYFENYQWVPLFKAGIHGGDVIRTQIGVVKKDIAYHGDAINTTARIRSMCTELNRDLLISETIKSKVKSQFLLKPEGKHKLRGKESMTTLYSVLNPLPEPAIEEKKRTRESPWQLAEAF